MPRPRPPFLHRERTRHGETVWYVRQGGGRRIRIRAAFGTDDFWGEYRAALEGKAGPDRRSSLKPHTLAWAIAKYRTRSEWLALMQATRRQRENIYRKVIETAGHIALGEITPEVIREGRERRKATPHSANNFLKAMRGFFAWAVDEGLVNVDPTKGVKLLKGPNDATGHHTWTEDEVQKFEQRWPVGTRERLALDFLLYTGLRRGDVVRVGRQHVRDNAISLTTEKGAVPIYIPISLLLSTSIDATPTGDLVFLSTKAGKPFSKESFGNWFRKACIAAGVRGRAHGLRKVGATRAAENRATDRELMAMFGWTTSKMATYYTQGADRKRLAQRAPELLLPARTENEKRPHLRSGAGVNPKTPKTSGV